MVRAGIYARISSDPDGDEMGVTRQVQDCLDMAQRRGWPVVERYVDDDVSAWSRRKRRPEYQRMLDDLAEGHINAVVVWHMDRLHRQPRELEDFLDVCDAAKVTDLATVTGDIDLSSYDGRCMARILGAVSAKESDDRSRRLLRKHAELAEQGKVNGGGPRPFGYTADRLRVVEGEAVIVREIVERLLAGDSQTSICHDLNRRGIRTSTGREWRQNTLKRMAISARISGQREHNGEIVADAVWPAIITPEQTARLRALFAAQARTGTRAPRRYLLAGLLRCGRCGTTLRAQPAADGTRRYRCPQLPISTVCSGIAIQAEAVEELIVEMVLYRLDTPELAAALDGYQDEDHHAAQARADLGDATERMEALAVMYADSEISATEWSAARKPLQARIDKANHTLARLTRTTAVDGYIGHADKLRAAWADLTLSRQQAIVKAVLDHATIAPTRRGRFNPDRVMPTWRV